MQFKLSNIILWPKNIEKNPVNIEFELDKINVITGGSSRGKSALLAIVDYCLCSSISRIPTRTIRDKTAWFGIVIQLENRKILLAREEPGESHVSNKMYMRESSVIQIPLIKPESNVNVLDVKSRLDNLAGLTRLGTSDFEDNQGFNSRPGFRDLISFNFQPQHLIANQSTIFYKTDVFKYREKLISIFPYILGAVDDEYLKNQEELSVLRREVRALRKDLDRRRSLVKDWTGSLRSTYIKAKELGLIKAPFPEDDWSTNVYIDFLRSVKDEYRSKIPEIQPGISTAVSQRVNVLENEEVNLSYALRKLKHRYELINRLEKSNVDYRNSLLTKNGKLKTVNWFNDLLNEHTNKCPLCQSETNQAKEGISRLIKVNEEIASKESQAYDNYQTLSYEKLSVQKEVRKIEKQINEVRIQIDSLRSSEDNEKQRLQNTLDIYRFIGNLETELNSYEGLNDNNDLLNEIEQKESRILELEELINEEFKERRLSRAKKIIEKNIDFYADLFGAENSDDTILFDEKNLTLNFISESGQSNALYEIGGGANYMQYHLSTLLGFHEFFVNRNFSPVPSFVFFDQPTQVYFPDNSESENAEGQEDIIKVRRIFEAMSKCLARTDAKLQMIVIEHVGEREWDQFSDDVVMIRRWRGDDNDSRLIPLDW